MVDAKLHERTQVVSFKDLSAVLNRSTALIRIIAKSLDIDVSDEQIPLNDALDLMRYFAGLNGEQDALWHGQNSKLQAAKEREIEYAVALEIVKRERAALEEQVKLLTQQLYGANQRSDRIEQKLHELTASFAHLVSQRDRLVAQTRSVSKTSIKQHNGRPVLYLERPVNHHLLGQSDQ
jgi:predicted nuclease with TOPRIM domain